MGKFINIPTSYQNFFTESVDVQHAVKGILVFNIHYPETKIYCHRIGYETERREDAAGVWRVTPKIIP
jgi:hypothetical protein